MNGREEIEALIGDRTGVVSAAQSAINATQEAFDALVAVDAEIFEYFTDLLAEQVVDEPISGVKVMSSAYAYGNTIAIPTHRVGDTIVVFAWGISRPGVNVAPAGYQQIASVERLAAATASPRSLRAIQKVAQSNQEANVQIANARILAVAVLRSASGVIEIGESSLHSGDNILNGLPLPALGASARAAKVLQFGGWRSTSATVAANGVPTHLSTLLLARETGQAGGALLVEAPEMRSDSVALSTVTLTGQPQGIMSVSIAFLDGAL